jgi:hypothetical protein
VAPACSGENGQRAAAGIAGSSSGQGRVTITSREYQVRITPGHLQLFAAAGLDPAQVAGRRLHEVAAAKFNRDGGDSRITVAPARRRAFAH